MQSKQMQVWIEEYQRERDLKIRDAHLKDLKLFNPLALSKDPR